MVLNQIKSCLDIRDYKKASQHIRNYSDLLNQVDDEEISMSLTSVYELSYEHTLFGMLITFLNHVESPEDKVPAVKILTTFSASSSKLVEVGLIEQKMDKFLTELLFKLDPIPDNNQLFRQIISTIGNFYADHVERVREIDPLILKDIVGRIMEFKRFREASLGSVQFLSAIHSDVGIDVVRNVMDREVVEFCVGVLEWRSDENSVMDVLNTVSVLTDARIDNEEEPFIQLCGFLYDLRFYHIANDILKDPEIRDQLKVLSMRCIGNVLCLEKSPDLDTVDSVDHRKWWRFRT